MDIAWRKGFRLDQEGQAIEVEEAIVDRVHWTRVIRESQRLEKENALLKRIVSRLPLCPDHRDKIQHRCVECSREAWKAKAEFLAGQMDAATVVIRTALDNKHYTGLI